VGSPVAGDGQILQGPPPVHPCAVQLPNSFGFDPLSRMTVQQLPGHPLQEHADIPISPAQLSPVFVLHWSGVVQCPLQPSVHGLLVLTRLAFSAVQSYGTAASALGTKTTIANTPARLAAHSATKPGLFFGISFPPSM
jgi:hypothetical protein